MDQSLKKDISYKLWCLSVNKRVGIPGRGHVTKWEGLLSRGSLLCSYWMKPEGRWAWTAIKNNLTAADTRPCSSVSHLLICRYMKKVLLCILLVSGKVIVYNLMLQELLYYLWFKNKKTPHRYYNSKSISLIIRKNWASTLLGTWLFPDSPM